MTDRRRFKKTDLLAITPPQDAKPLAIYDTEVPKLCLRVTKTGAKTFYVIKRIGAKVEWLKLGAFPETTVEQARSKAQQLLGEIAEGVNPAEVKRNLRGEGKFSDAVDDFLREKRKRDGSPIGEKTKRDYKDLLTHYLAPIAGKKLSAIERSDVRAIFAKANQRSPAQADKCVALVSAVFNFLNDNERFDGVNPAKGIKKNPPKSRARFIQSDELPYFFEALSKAATNDMRDLFLLALLTGARRANVCAMAWNELDLDGTVWVIPKTKNGTSQNVPLSPEATEILVARKGHKDPKAVYVFPSESKTGHIVEPKRAWKRVLHLASIYRLADAMQLSDAERSAIEEQMGRVDMERIYDQVCEMTSARGLDPEQHVIKDLRPHDLRRTLGSWQAKAGASLAIIGKSLNHKTHQATAIYARLDMDPVRQSVNTATAAILAAAGVRQTADIQQTKKEGAA